MAPTEVPVVRLRLPYPDAETFVEKFAPNVTRGGIFLASREPRAVGSLLRFELSVGPASEPVLVLAGEGKVTWVKAYDPAAPHRAYGMGVQFTALDASSRALVERMASRRDPARRTTSSMPAARPTPAVGTPVRERPTELDAPVEDTTVKRALERARVLSARIDDLDALLTREPEAPATLSDALAELPRLISGRRTTTVMRAVSEPSETPAPAAPAELPSPLRVEAAAMVDTMAVDTITVTRAETELSAASRVS